MRRVVSVLAFFLFVAPSLLVAQAVPPPTPPPTTGTGQFPLSAARNTALQDSLQKTNRVLVHWPPADSVLLSLTSSSGGAVSQFVGDSLRIDGVSGRMTLYGDTVAVKRDSALIVAYGGWIEYNKTLEILAALGDTIVLRDPARNAADVVARGSMIYDMLHGRAKADSVSTTTVENGEMYMLTMRRAALVSDTVTGRYTQYGHYGSLTTCPDKSPHFHVRVNSFKMVTGKFIVGSPATFYIADVPIMVFPFFINDMRTGRRSGLLTPRFGFSDIVRNSSHYRRQIENVGWYWAMSDYMDSKVWMDWRSGADGRTGDPGWIRYSAEMNYKWLNRFLSGRVGVAYSKQGDGRTNTQLSLSHSQTFSGNRRLSADLNYVTSTAIQQRQEFIPSLQLATISSRLNYSQTLGPLSISAGGSRTQFPGQEQEDQVFPTLSVSSKPVTLFGGGDAGATDRFAVTITPNLSFNNSQRFKFERGGPLSYRYFVRPDGLRDSVKVRGDSRNTTMSLDLPILAGKLRLSNSFHLTDVEDNYPQAFLVRDVRDTSISETRVYPRTFRTELDWRPSVSLPATFLQRTLNVTPSIGIVNVHPAAYWVRSERSGGEFVAQSKRPVFGLGMSPTLHGFFSGFGPYARIRHSIALQLSYGYSPAADVSDDYLEAIGSNRQGYLGSLPQSAVTLGMSHVFEASLKSDSIAGIAGRKVRLLSLNLSSLTYDFERAKATGRTGLTTDNFGINARSDLLPGLDFSADYSLFQGSTLSDSARFKPFLRGLRSSFSVSKNNNPFASLIALVTGRKPAAPAQTGALGGQVGQPSLSDPFGPGGSVLPGGALSSAARAGALGAGGASEFSARIDYTLSRQRPPVGNVVLIENIAAQRCAVYLANPLLYDPCIREFEALSVADPNGEFRPPGGAFISQPTRSTMSLSVSTPLTPKWSASWSTNYDFEVGDFASHIINLTRDLHEWNANFSFTQSPNGNFMFSFLISLKAQPDVKFEHHEGNYGRGGL